MKGSEKVPMTQKVKDVLLHYYHGFRLLALDVRVAFRLLWKTMKGSSLTRRELKQVGVELEATPVWGWVGGAATTRHDSIYSLSALVLSITYICIIVQTHCC